MTITEFKAAALKKHGNRYNYEQSVYVNTRTNLIIMCSQHGDFSQNPRSHLNGSGCPKCAHLLTTEEFKARAKRRHGDRYSYDNATYVNAKTKVCITCLQHGEFRQTAGEHLSGAGCPGCKLLKATSNIEEFIVKARKVHGDKYSYEQSVYVSAITPMIIICPTRGEFRQTPNNHLNGSGCSSNRRKPIADDFVMRAQEIHGDRYLYEKTIFVNSATDIVITCLEHGDFQQKPGVHLSGSGCRRCSIERSTSNTEEFKVKARKIHGSKYDYSNVIYTKSNEFVSITCFVHGQFEQLASVHLRGNGCHQCSVDSTKSNVEAFEAKSREIHGEKYGYEDTIYTNSATVVIIVCRKHGRFQQSPKDHLRGRGCPTCSFGRFSKGQIEWLEFVERFDGIHIQHMGNSSREFQIESTRWRADGYCRETNTIYEYHGTLWHGSPKFYDPDMINPLNKKTMGELYANTLERERGIRELGYNLVVMWEHDWNEIRSTFELF